MVKPRAPSPVGEDTKEDAFHIYDGLAIHERDGAAPSATSLADLEADVLTAVRSTYDGARETPLEPNVLGA